MIAKSNALTLMIEPRKFCYTLYQYIRESKIRYARIECHKLWVYEICEKLFIVNPIVSKNLVVSVSIIVHIF